MNRFEHTSIWQKTLGKQLKPDIYEKQRDFLRVEFENFREKAKLLAAEIANILPDFTVHDITHIDALWDTAEIVAKEDFELNPVEGFVLGGAFLIHDLGMGLASFPDGIEELKKEAIWKDTVYSLLKEKLCRDLNEDDLLNVDNGIGKAATENVLRLLHAKHAEKLALISWTNNKGESSYLIDNIELREAYGSIIGLIAHSHWWTVDDLENKLPKILGAAGIFPSSWTVDPIKLACVLRIADAIQIDDRRAPSFLRTIRRPNNYSDNHWNFQQKLYQPRLEKSRLVFTSKSPFSISEIESWWICHDTLQMIDNELKDVDSLLIDTNRQRLKAIAVASVEDPKRLSKLIAVDGWQPIDTKIKVSNVAKLVGSLGGKQLYGDNLNVPLRELIQNASDAIRARRVIENESPSFGNIIVRLGKDEYGEFVELEDNGIGMSQKVLTGPFIDFGQSFWGTSLMHEELPGLESKGFSPTGKYGIGFFSAFMWGDKVSVCSKRFENGRDSSLILEFDRGARSRPILRKANDREVIKDGGTRIRVWLRDDSILEKLLETPYLKRHKISFAELIGKLCPSIDCNVILEENGSQKYLIKANDWISIQPLDLIKRIVGISFYKELSKIDKKFLEKISKNMTIISEQDGTVVGRLLIFRGERYKEERMAVDGMVTVGGLKTSSLTGVIGILLGKSVRASRDIGMPIVSDSKLQEWATDQASLLSKFNLDANVQIECAAVIRSCKGNTRELCIAMHKNLPLNYQDLKSVIKQTKMEKLLVVQDAAILHYERYTKCKIDLFDNVFYVDVGMHTVLQTGDMDIHIGWPESGNEEPFNSRTLEGLVYKAISEVWNIDIDQIYNNSEISSDERSYEASVGKVNDEDVIIDYLDIVKKHKKA